MSTYQEEELINKCIRHSSEMSDDKNRNTGTSVLERAIFDDCNTLIENFVQHGDPHFAPFCTEWKEMQFNQLFQSQASTVMLMQTTAAALHLPKRYMCGRWRNSLLCAADKQTTLLRRIGGLYLLYVIYLKQPTQRYVKIEVSMETWKEMRDFIDGLSPRPEFDDARYCFWKLVKSHAFRYTAVDYCKGLEDLVDYDSIYYNQPAGHARPNADDADLNELGRIQGTTQAMAILEDGYNEMKEMLTNRSSIGAKALPPTTIVKELNDMFNNIQSMLIGGSAGEISSKALNESRKAALKRRGAKFGSMRKHIKTETPDYNTDDDNTPGTSKQCQKKMSLRTIFTEELPQHLIYDLDDDLESGDEELHIDKDKSSETSNQTDGVKDDNGNNGIENLI